MSVGTGLPYVGLWLKSQAMTDPQVGFILACPSFAMVATTLLIGRLADRAKDWRTSIIVCNWAIVLLVGFLIFAQGFVQILIVWTLWGLVIMAKFPILDAAAVRMSRHRNIEFHKIRAVGSVGFVVGTLLAGPFFEWAGIESFTLLIFTLAVMRALASHALPFFRQGIDASSESATGSALAGATAGKVASDHGSIASDNYKRMWFLLVLVGSALLHASHAFYYTFSTIVWTDEGFSKTTISLLWSIGVICEIVLMWKFAVIQKKYSARILLIAAAGSAFVRWLCFGFAPGLAMLFLLQLLHGVTFALMFLATVNFIANWTPVEISARAQALSATLNTLLMACATVLSGFIFGALQLTGYWIMAALCLLAILMVSFSWCLAGKSD